MRIGRVAGSVTLCRVHPALTGATWKVVRPLGAAELKIIEGGGSEEPAGATELFCVYDELGAGEGAIGTFSEGGEAAQPFQPAAKPVDAYLSALIDRLHLPGLEG